MDEMNNVWQQQQMVLPEMESVREPVPVRPWGFWATTGFGAIMTVVYFVLIIIIVVVFVIAMKVGNPQVEIEQIGTQLEESGFLMSVSSMILTPPVIVMCLVFAWCRKGMQVSDYLALRRPNVRQLLIWLGVLVGFMIVSDSLTLIIGRPIVHESMVTAYETSVLPPLLFFVIIVCAPLSEEILFRGFLFKGWKSSPIGPVGATILTSLLWAIIHVQYDWYGITTIFVGGLMLGAARIHTRSIWVPILMHAVMNIVASGQLLFTRIF